MSASTHALERRLVEDLTRLGERLADGDRFCRDLYAALAGFTLRRAGDGDARIAPSWTRAEALLNEARAAVGLPPLEGLAQSGVEGRLTERAREALESLGWTLEPRVTDRQDPAHASSPEDPPPARHEPPEWEREAHEEAELERHRQRIGETRAHLHDRHGV